MPFGQDTLAGSSGCLVPARAINGLMGSPRLISIGYEGRDVDELVTQLLAQSVTTLVDVRLIRFLGSAACRKPPCEKRSTQPVSDTFIIVNLETPKTTGTGIGTAINSAYDRFGEVLQGPAAGRALKHVSELLRWRTRSPLVLRTRPQSVPSSDGVRRFA